MITRIASQITKDALCHTNNYLPLTISLDIVWTMIYSSMDITRLYTAYFNCIEFYQHQFIHLGEVLLTINMVVQTDMVKNMSSPRE